MGTDGDRRSRWRRLLAEPVDPASMALWRIVFGAFLFVAVVRFFAHGWIDDFYLDPEFYFSYPGFAWLRPLPAAGMYAVFAALGALALCIAAGVRLRISASLFLLGFLYVELLDQTHYLNHYYLVALLLFLLIWMPIGRGRSSAPRWCLWLLRAQVGLVYVMAGIAKLGSDWLLDAQPLQVWLAARGDLPLVGPLLGEPAVAHLAAWAGAVFDLTVVAFLLWRRTRAVAFAACVAFHALTAALFPIGLFPWIMIANATLFFSPSWPRRFLGGQKAALAVREMAPKRLSRVAGLAIALYLALQIAIPFRHFLYPGDVLWTEEGMRFSWRVMRVEKAGVARFRVVDSDSGRAWLVYPRDILSPRQEKMMAIQPELIRQFASELARRARARGIARPEVYADVVVARSGLRSRPLVDPEADLAGEDFSLGAYPWIAR